MQITMKRELLYRALQRVQGVVERRNTMPVLSHVLIEAKGSTLTLFATDLELGLTGEYEAKVEKPGRLTISARKLYEIVRELSEEEIHLVSTDEKSVRLEAGKSRFQMMTLPPDEFPSLPIIEESTEFKIDGAVLGELIRQTLFAVGENDARYVLNGTLMTTSVSNGKTNLRLVGTDGHRLAIADREVSSLSGPTKGKGGLEINAIIPRKALLEIRRLLEDPLDSPLTVGIAKNQISVQRNDAVLVSRLMEGTYPNYQQVVPKGTINQFVIPRAVLGSALRRVSLLAREKTHAVKWEMEKNRLILTASNPDIGEAQEELSIAYSGEAISTGFNARYLLDALAVVESDEVAMEFKDALSPCVIKESGGKEFLCVVMPMRI